MRFKVLGVVLALGALVAVPAFADEGKGGPRPNFPMPAAQFKEHVAARQAKARQHMEERASKLDATQAKELRAKFDARTAAVNAEVAKVIADGTVTKDEAHAVRAAGGHGHGGDCKKGEKK